MRVFTAPEKITFSLPDEAKIFLAGSIEQGKAVNWQQATVERFKDLPGVLFNPRREIWDASLTQDITNPVFKEQVTWELDALELADVVFFYFQADTLSPISLMELGIVATWVGMADDPPYVVLVCEDGFWRAGNIQVLCERAGIRILPTLERGLNHLAEVCARAACGH